MKPLNKLLSESYQDFRSNRKLQYGLLAIALIVCVEWGMRWSDSLDAREKQLQQLHSEVRMLRNQSRDEEALRQLLSELETAQQAVDKRLWVVSSDAVGQARLKDWLTNLVKKAGVKNFKLVLSSPRALGQSDGQDMSAGAITGSGKAARDSLKSLRELRANLTLYFSPETLEKVLLEIEGGEPLAAVESLNVKRQERKVEMSVRVLMRIGAAESEKIDSGMGGEQSSVSKISPAEDSATGLTGTKPLQAADEAPGVKK